MSPACQPARRHRGLDEHHVRTERGERVGHLDSHDSGAEHDQPVGHRCRCGDLPVGPRRERRESGGRWDRRRRSGCDHNGAPGLQHVIPDADAALAVQTPVAPDEGRVGGLFCGSPALTPVRAVTMSSPSTIRAFGRRSSPPEVGIGSSSSWFGRVHRGFGSSTSEASLAPVAETCLAGSTISAMISPMPKIPAAQTNATMSPWIIAAMADARG